MRIGLIGNMNNSNFSVMRYFRDMGLDAYLLMYNNEAAHFYPQHDTWHWEKWAPYVKQLSVSNGGPDGIFGSPRSLFEQLQAFDVFIGNGISPVLFARMGKTLDLFVPYGEGVEFIIEHTILWKHPAYTAFSWFRKRMMESALRTNVKAICTANLHPHSQRTYERLGLTPLNLPSLPLYIEPKPEHVSLPPQIAPLVERMQRSTLVVFSHVSHVWKNLPAPHFMGGVGKRNNWLVEGFAEYCSRSGDSRSLLCLFDYGVDTAETKALVRQLRIQDQVIWFPKMSRREIMCLLPYADVGGSEFAGMLWGGCGWEFLASGTPMLHQLCDSSKYDAPNMPLPPFFNVHSPHDIAKVLLDNNRENFREMGRLSKTWFEKHQGGTLAGRYLDVLRRLQE